MASQAAAADKLPEAASSSAVAPKQKKEPRKELYPMVNWKYDLFLYVMGNVADLFFREVVSRGSWKVPQSGPVLFVAGPHANQVCTLSPSVPLSRAELPPSPAQSPADSSSSSTASSSSAPSAKKPAAASPSSSPKSRSTASSAGPRARSRPSPSAAPRTPRSPAPAPSTCPTPSTTRP